MGKKSDAIMDMLEKHILFYRYTELRTASHDRMIECNIMVRGLSRLKADIESGESSV